MGPVGRAGVFTGFDKWLAANDEDVAWATTVADAFAAAGGEGSMSTLSNGAIAAALQAAGVHLTRTDLVIEPPQAYGFPPTTGYADDPVNTSTGNFVENETDLAIPGAAALLVWGRCYNSFDTGAGGFGPGWSSLAGAGLGFDPDAGVALFRLPDGRVLIFPRLGDGWDRAVGENVWLTKVPAEGPDAAGSGRFRVAGTDGAWWSCGPDGTLLAFGTGPEADGNLVRLVRDQAGRLVRLQRGRGPTPSGGPTATDGPTATVGPTATEGPSAAPSSRRGIEIAWGSVRAWTGSWR